MRTMVIVIGTVALLYSLALAAIGLGQRKFIYFPSHQLAPSVLAPWTEHDQVIGFCRVAKHPRTVWLMTHGNAGQADQRGYVLSHLPETDSLYVLEYPGYGQRPGSPSMASMNAAAAEAYQALRREHPGTPVGVIGESIGTGPASYLCSLPQPPDAAVLVVPFDVFARVAAEHMPWVPVRMLLHDTWDNTRALQAYRGPVTLYGAKEDQIIPIAHARALAAAHPGARLVEIEGGHNDWSASYLVRIER